jgi:hypothetical protein
MKILICKSLILLLIGIVLPVFLFAHEGGHFHKGDGAVMNTWQLENGKVIRGNFSNGDKYFVYLEQEEGKIIAVPLRQLAGEDRALARFKIRREESINQLNEIPILNQKTPKPFRPDLLPLAMLFAFLGLLSFIYHRYSGVMVFQKTAYRVSFALVVVIASIFACKKSTDVPTAGGTEIIPKTSIGFLDSSFSLYKPGITTSHDNT